jgi:putative oxidoreductase
MLYPLRGLLSVVGRVALGAIFLMSAAGHATDFQTITGYMAAKHVPSPEVLLVGAIVFLLFGSLSVMAGFKARVGALLLLVFLAAVTPIFHDFWNLAPEAQRGEMVNFMKNLALGGAMLLVIANGPGPFSFDERARRART